MKKRLLALIFAALMAASLTACGGDTNTPTVTQDEQPEQAEQTTGEDAEQVDSETAEEPEAPAEQVVLLDQNNLKITFTGIGEDLLGPQVKLLIENNSDQNYTVQTQGVSVNGFMMEPLFSEDVAPGKKSNCSIDFLADEFSENGITEITNIELTFHVCDSETFQTIFDSSAINIDI